ncbi:MAG: hypothetical protein R2702_08830 [Acidimicrobiales bacterium]
MAGSSSAKKVARVAAKSGSGHQPDASAKQRNWLFAVAIIAIVALGIGIVVFARDKNGGGGDNATPPRANLGDGNPSDHWHAAFAVNVCGKEITPLQDGPTDVEGIHTHGDGLIHIHPFTRSAAGDRATMSKFFKQVSFTVTDSGFQLPAGTTTEDGGTTVKEGETTCGGKAGEVVLAHWKDAVTAAGTEPDKIFTKDFGSVPFTEDGGAFTLAYVVKGTKDIPAPSTAAEIQTLGAVDGAPTPSSDGGSSTVTVPVSSDGSDTSTDGGSGTGAG